MFINIYNSTDILMLKDIVTHVEIILNFKINKLGNTEKIVKM